MSIVDIVADWGRGIVVTELFEQETIEKKRGFPCFAAYDVVQGQEGRDFGPGGIDGIRIDGVIAAERNRIP